MPATISELTVGLTRFLLGNAYCVAKASTTLGAPEHCHHSLCIRARAPLAPGTESFVHPVASVVAVELYLLLAGTCIFVVAEGKRGSANPQGVAWPWYSTATNHTNAEHLPNRT